MLIKNVSSKICFVGDGGVGKTSLICRFVHDLFDDKYLATIGTKVSRKEIVLDYPDKNLRFKMDAMIWDIMGQKAFRGMLQGSYFHGAKGILGVCSLTDLDSLKNLNDWIESVKAVVGEIPIVLLANKNDLKNEVQFDDGYLKEMANSLNATYLYTSAKTGENVGQAFSNIAKQMIKNQFKLDEL